MSHTILIVEDDPDGLATLREILELEGYMVEGATNGEEALTRLRRGPKPSLILLDLMLPVMNGWQLRQAQQEDPELASIPVIVVSAYKDAAAVAESLGVADFVNKPIQLDELLAKMARWVAPAVPQPPNS